MEFSSVKEHSCCRIFWNINVSFFMCGGWPEHKNESLIGM